MNRFAIAGIAQDAITHRTRFVYVCRASEIKPALDLFVDLCGPYLQQVHRSNGAQRITFRTGSVVSFATTARLRGATADVVYLADYDAGLNPNVLTDAEIVVSSSGGAVVRA